MTSSRKLALKKETLTELSPAELTAVAGASGLSCKICISNPCSDFRECLPTGDCFTGTSAHTALCETTVC